VGEGLTSVKKNISPLLGDVLGFSKGANEVVIGL